MDYIKKSLLKDEQITFYTKPHYIIFVRAICCLLISLLFFVDGPNLPFLAQHAILLNIPTYQVLGYVLLFWAAYLGLKAVIYYTCSEYGITNRRVLIKVGFIQRYSLELFLKQIEGIEINQNIPGRIFNYGTVTIRGIGGSRDYFPYIPKPMLFRESVQKQIESSKSSGH